MTTNSIRGKRLFNLLQYEFAMHKKLYLMGTPGLFLMIILTFLIVLYSNRNALNWTQPDYAGLFYTELFFLTIFGLSYSFIDLRSKDSARQYLTLPGTAAEKYTVQFLTRILMFPVLFAILFVLGTEIAKILFHLGSLTLDNKPPRILIDDLDVVKLLPIGYSWNLPVVYYMVYGLGGLIVSLMFAGGIIFGKGNPLLMPLSFIGAGLSVVLTGIVMSRILVGAPQPGAGFFSTHIDLQQPEIFGDTPLLVFVSTVWIWLAIPVFLWVAYLKLKEREV
jgi:hypothetical protein